MVNLGCILKAEQKERGGWKRRSKDRRQKAKDGVFLGHRGAIPGSQARAGKPGGGREREGCSSAQATLAGEQENSTQEIAHSRQETHHRQGLLLNFPYPGPKHQVDGRDRYQP